MNKYYVLIVILSIIGGILAFFANDIEWFYTWCVIAVLIAVTDFFDDSVKNQKEQTKYLENINNNIAKILTEFDKLHE